MYFLCAAASKELFPAQKFVHPSIYTLPLNTDSVAQLRACNHIWSDGAGAEGRWYHSARSM